MDAVHFDGGKKELKLIRKDVPQIQQPNELLIKICYAGVCGTDLHIIQGEFPAKQDGVTLGHEFSGIIEKIGDGVGGKFRVGDRVVVDPNRGCKVCEFCHAGESHFCQTGSLFDTLGIFRNGGWAQYCLVPDYQVSEIPEGVTLAQAALCEPISCLAHGWDKISPLPVGKRILILGAGIIGVLWTICLHLQGHRRVTISEPNQHRRSKVDRLKTGYDVITPDQLEGREGVSYDVIIDCSGYGPAIEKAVDLLNYGGKLCVFGVAAPHTTVRISPYKIFDRELTILGVRINPFTFPKALGLLESLGERYLNYDDLGVKVFRLDEYRTALEELKKGTISKAMFKL